MTQSFCCYIGKYSLLGFGYGIFIALCVCMCVLLKNLTKLQIRHMNGGLLNISDNVKKNLNSCQWSNYIWELLWNSNARSITRLQKGFRVIRLQVYHQSPLSHPDYIVFFVFSEKGFCSLIHLYRDLQWCLKTQPQSPNWQDFAIGLYLSNSNLILKIRLGIILLELIRVERSHKQRAEL